MSDETQIEHILLKIDSLQRQIEELPHLNPLPEEGGTIVPNASSDFSSIAEAELKRYDIRDRHFPSDQFSEASWHIILDLFIHEQASKKVSVTSACIASRKPQTTGLRWVRYLESIGYVVREEDRDDHRKSYLRLSDQCRSKVRNYLAETQAL